MQLCIGKHKQFKDTYMEMQDACLSQRCMMQWCCKMSACLKFQKGAAYLMHNVVHSQLPVLLRIQFHPGQLGTQEYPH